ncbi:Meiotic nuclear division protein 1 [Tyrophagus putrescentiae]|nr:Meiotic nuclear division protein 1 [Tyrophagus putrescentiae]
MSRKKGLSMEEKRVRLLELFHEKQEPFLLKDLEKAATKEKGIPLQTVKDVLTSLVSDDMVDTDKIGTSVYFWSFPSKNSTIVSTASMWNWRRKTAQLEAEIAEKLKSSSESEEEAKRRSELQDELVAAEKESAEVAKELAKFESCDPDTFEKKKEEIETLREGVERWTDNIFAIRTYCKNKFNMEYSEIDRQLGFPPDLDYFELDEDK